MHATAAAKPIPIPHNQKSKSMSARTRARGHSIAQTASAAANKPASPSHRSQSPMMAQLQQHSASTSAPSSAAIFSTSASTRAGPSSTASKSAGNKSSSSAASSRDLNIREFFPEDDAALLKFMDNASIIKAQRDALQALNDAALARALRESEELAAKEEFDRKGKGKERAELPKPPVKAEGGAISKEKDKVETEVVIAKEGVISPAESGAAIPLPGSDRDASREIKVSKEEIVPVPVADTVTKSGEEQVRGHQQEALRSSAPTPLASSSSKEQPSTSTMTVSPPAPPNVHAFGRYSEDEAAARLLARGWGVASLQGALLQNPDMAPPSPTQHQIPVSASSSTSSSSSSVAFSPTSSANSSMTSVSSSVSSLSSSASAAARKTAVVATTTASASPTASRVMPMTIPAEAFYSRSSRHKRGDSDDSSSSASSSNTIFSSSRPSTATTSPGSSSQKSSPPTPYIMPTSPTKERPNSSRPGFSFTSASLAAAAQAQAHAQAQAQATAKSNSIPTSIPENVKARGGPIISTTFTSTSTTTAHNSTIRVHGTSRPVPTETLHRRSISSSSPERPRTAPSPVATPTKVHKVHTSTLVSPLSPSKAPTTATKSNSSVPSSSTNAASAVASTTPANVTVISKGVISPSTSSHNSVSSEKSRSPSVSSPLGISPSTSATSSSSVNSTSTSATSVSASSSVNVASTGPVIVTSASKVAAEKEREREKEREKSRIAAAITSKFLKSTMSTTTTTIPSSSASAAAKRASTSSRPAPISVNTPGGSGDHSRERSNTEQRDRNEVTGLGLQGLSSLPSNSVSSSAAAVTTTLPEPILRATFGLEAISTFSSSPSSSSSHQKKTNIGTTPTALTSASSSASAAAAVVKNTSASSSAASTPQRPLSPHTVRPRDADELFSVPLIVASSALGGVGSGGLGVGGTSGVGGQQQQVGSGVVGVVKAVVPVSSLSESDDEDDGVEEEEKEEDADDERGDDEDGSDEDEEEEEFSEEVKEVKEETEAMEMPMTEDVSFLDVYTADRSCSKCGESIVYSPYNPKKSSYASSFTLHISCPRCSTLHCRGCASPATKCPKECTGPGNSAACSIVNDCCSRVRAIAIFEALSASDKAYLAEVNGGRKAGYAEREEFIRDLISKPVGPQARRLEAVFVRCMNLLVEVFNSTSSSSSKFLSATLVSHFERSLMPEVIHLYLENTNVKDWITHSDVYTAILDLLRYMFEAGFGEGVMDVELRRVGESKGLREWLLVGEKTMGWVRRAKDEKEVRGSEMSRGLLKGGAERVVDTYSTRKGETLSSVVVAEVGDKEEHAATMEPLKSLIMGLEMHRTSLLEVLDKVTFMPTVEKLNVLCDGISQLVLGQVLGI